MAWDLFSLGNVWKYSKGLMTSHFLHENARGMKEATIDEFPCHPMFVEYDIDDNKHVYSDYVGL